MLDAIVCSLMMRTMGLSVSPSPIVQECCVWLLDENGREGSEESWEMTKELSASEYGR